MDRSELLNRIKAGRAEFDAAVNLFDKHDLAKPLLENGWSVKDVLAHICFWEKRIVSLYETLAAGDEPKDTVGAKSLDELNTHVYEENQLLPLGIVQVNEREAYLELLNVAETAPEADLFDPDRFAWCEGQPFYNWIAENTYLHYADHLPNLLAAAPK